MYVAKGTTPCFLKGLENIKQVPLLFPFVLVILVNYRTHWATSADSRLELNTVDSRSLGETHAPYLWFNLYCIFLHYYSVPYTSLPQQSPHCRVLFPFCWIPPSPNWAPPPPAVILLSIYESAPIYFCLFIRFHIWVKSYGTCLSLPGKSSIFWGVNDTQAPLVDSAGLVLEHCDKVSITPKRVTLLYWFTSAYKSYVYTIL